MGIAAIEDSLEKSLVELRRLPSLHREAALLAVAAFVNYIGAAAVKRASLDELIQASGSTKANFNCPNCGKLLVAEYK